MALVLDQVHACEEGGVEDRGGELTHATADLVLQHTLGDGPGRDESLCRRAFADVAVEAERFTRSNDGAPYEIGDEVDVGDAGLAA